MVACSGVIYAARRLPGATQRASAPKPSPSFLLLLLLLLHHHHHHHPPLLLCQANGAEQTSVLQRYRPGGLSNARRPSPLTD
nr:unnamed protein product [Spirometra erinaceieuropaei]